MPDTKNIAIKNTIIFIATVWDKGAKKTNIAEIGTIISNVRKAVSFVETFPQINRPDTAAIPMADSTMCAVPSGVLRSVSRKVISQVRRATAAPAAIINVVTISKKNFLSNDITSLRIRSVSFSALSIGSCVANSIGISAGNNNKPGNAKLQRQDSSRYEIIPGKTGPITNPNAKKLNIVDCNLALCSACRLVA